MTQTYRTTDLTRWGSGKGSRLTSTEADINFWDVWQAIVALQSSSGGARIDYFEVSGTQFYVHMTDHSILGPYDLPVATFDDKGDWAPNTSFAKLDVVHENGSVYWVQVPHTSAATFDAGATDGSGHDLYVLLVGAPGNALPTGGAVGQRLTKSTTADFAVTWSWTFPTTGKSTGKILWSNSSTADDTSWVTPPFISEPPASPGGSVGQVPATVDGTATSMEWIDVVYAPPPSPAGSAGWILTTVDGTNTNTEWVDPTSVGGGGGATALSALTDVGLSGLANLDFLVYDSTGTEWTNLSLADVIPNLTGGTEGQMLHKVNSTDLNFEWKQTVFPLTVEFSESDLTGNVKQYVSLPFKGWVIGQTSIVQKTITTGGTIDLNVNGGSSLSGGQVTFLNGDTPGVMYSSSGITTGTSSQFVKGDRIEVVPAGFATAGRVRVTLLLVPRH